LHAFIARLAIHIPKIASRGIERYKAVGPAILPLPKVSIEQDFPSGSVQLRRAGHDAVHVEDNSVEVQR
jgi:hypothetical protein